MLPQGIFSVAVATVLFPTLSRLAARGRHERLPHHVCDAGCARSASCSSRPARSIAALAEPIVRLVYQRGEFTSDQTAVVAQCLAAFSLGLAFNGAMLMLNRAFFSLQSTWVPTSVALGNLGLNAALDALFYRGRRLGDPALDVAREHRRPWRCCIQLLRRRIGRLELKETIRSTVRRPGRCRCARRRRLRGLDVASTPPSAGRSARRSCRSLVALAVGTARVPGCLPAR